MLAYSYDDNSKYIGTCPCQRDPIASDRAQRDIYLLPGSATWEAPPAYDEAAEIPVWNGEHWKLEKLPEPAPEPIPNPNPSPTLEERITEQEAKQLRTDTAMAELSILIANTIAPSAE